MSLKAELETRALALKAYEAGKYDEAIAYFDNVADTSKICWNVGIILATLGRHEEAVEHFAEATAMDGFFTVAYQQKGVSNFMLGRYDAANKDFEDALLYLRGNQTINYEQLGLDFRLYSAEVLFNCGLTKIYLGHVAAGMADLREAQKQKQVAEHGVIDDAIRDQGRDYTVFSVPVGVLFRPSPIKLKNLAAKDYMGKAVLVAASDVNDAYTTFTGITRLRRRQTPTGAPLDAGHPLGRSASVSAIPEPVDKTPITTRLARSNTVAMSRRDAASPADHGNYGASTRNTAMARPTLPRLDTDVPSVFPRPSPASRSISPWEVGKNNSPPSRSNTLGVTLNSTTSGRESPLLRTPSSAANQPRLNTLRVTELYDDYFKDLHDDDLANLPPIGGKKKEMEAWARKTPAGAAPGGRSGRSESVSERPAPPPPSSFTGGRGLTRAPSRSSSVMGASRDSRYKGERASDAGSFYDMNKIRVKVHAGNLTRGMSIFPDQSFADFCSSLRTKFPGLLDDINVRFGDEDGDVLSMQDAGDFEAAVDVARVMAKGRAEGKLEIWVD